MQTFGVQRLIRFLFALTLVSVAVAFPAAGTGAAQVGTPIAAPAPVEDVVDAEPTFEESVPLATEPPPTAPVVIAATEPLPTAPVVIAATQPPPIVIAATEPPPTVPGATATVSPEPNTDAVSFSGPAQAVLEPGGEQTYTITYMVTTLRTGTAVHAELRLADGSPASAWVLRAQAGAGGWVQSGAAAEVADQSALGPGTSFSLSIRIVAPAAVVAEQTVSLFVSSSVSTDHGDEIGIESAGPLASLTVAPLPATPNSLTCDAPTATTIEPGKTVELACRYTVNDPTTPARVSAAFATAAGEGWTLAFGGNPAGETATWTPSALLAAGQAVDLLVRVTAPADAKPGQQLTVTLATGDAGPAATWPLTVAAPEDGEFSTTSVDPTGGICGQTSPAGDLFKASSFPAMFSCGLDGLNASDVYEIRISAPSAGWEYAAFRQGSISYKTSPYSTFTPTDLLPTFSIYLRMTSYPSYPLDESVGTLTVEYMGWVCDAFHPPCGEVLLRSVTLRITWPAPDVTCDLISPPGAQVGLWEYATFKCTHSNPAFQLTNQTSIDPHWRWSVSTGGSPIVPSYWSSSTVPPNLAMDAVFVYIMPNPDDPPAAGTVQHIPVVFRQDGSKIDTQKTLTVTYAPPTTPCDPTATLTGAVDFGTSTWNGDGYTPATGALGIAIAPSTAPGCGAVSDGWSVSVQSDGLSRDGDPGTGDRIPPEAMTYQGTAAGGNVPAGLTPAAPAALGPAGPVTIATGTASGTGEWDAAFQLQPPGEAPPGNYSGTITVTIANGS